MIDRSVAPLRTIEVLVDEHKELLARACEADTWRDLAKGAIETIHAQQNEIERQRRQLAALREELREHRDSQETAAV